MEIGSYCGRSTVVLASVVQALGSPAQVHGIDPHEGTLAVGGAQAAPTLERLRENLRRTGLADAVGIVPRRSCDVVWTSPSACCSLTACTITFDRPAPPP